LNRTTIAILAVAIVAFAAGVITIRSPSSPTSAAQMKNEQKSEGLSRAMTFTSPAEPKK
jgi:hypothetical protein